MSPTFSQLVPQSYGYVLASLSAVAPLLIWQTIKVGGARKRAGIPYPQMYATPEQQASKKEALIFNCTQRAHGNTLELVPTVMFSTLYTGLQFPRFAAAACATFVLGRILYTLGYTTGEPAKRQWGMMGSAAVMSLVIGSLYTSYRVIVDGLI